MSLSEKLDPPENYKFSTNIFNSDYEPMDFGVTHSLTIPHSLQWFHLRRPKMILFITNGFENLPTHYPPHEIFW